MVRADISYRRSTILWSDLLELKSVLQIQPENTNEDLTLNFYLEWASNWLEELTNRQFVYKTRTLPYKGTGTQKLLLRHRPVYPAPSGNYSPISVSYNSQGYFGCASGAFTGTDATQLVYGVDYALQVDQDDGGSRCGILWRINDYWYKPTVREAGYLFPFVSDDPGSYQITYSAGFTVDTLPGQLRAACDLLASAYRYCFPLGMALGHDSYQERSISIIHDKKDYLLALVKPHLSSFTNWKF